MGLWAASLARFGLRDPFAPLAAFNLQDRDASTGSAEDIAEKYRAMERWGGPPVPLDAALRAEIAALVKTEMDGLGAAETLPQGALDRAHLCWIILHDLGETRLNRRGFKALLALQSSGGTDAAEAVLNRVEACDPRLRMRDHAQALLDADIASLTGGKSHADLLQALTGENLLERVNDYIIGLCSAFLAGVTFAPRCWKWRARLMKSCICRATSAARNGWRCSTIRSGKPNATRWAAIF